LAVAPGVGGDTVHAAVDGADVPEQVVEAPYTGGGDEARPHQAGELGSGIADGGL
jgi:hypothetical protein